MHWIEFTPCDREDAIAMAKGLCDVDIEESLLDELIDATRGEIRRLVVGLAQIEKEAKNLGISTIGKSQFKREFFLGHRPATKGRR